MTIVGVSVTEATPSTAVDLATFDRNFAEARERVLRVCIGLVGRDHAEDVLHDTYLRTRDRRSQLRDSSLFEAWICRAAINLCFNRHRDRRRLLDRLPRLAQSIQQPQTDAGLRELIERLSPRDRTVVVLHYGYGYRLEEIADLLGLTPVNARTILFRARRRLGAQLREAER